MCSYLIRVLICLIVACLHSGLCGACCHGQENDRVMRALDARLNNFLHAKRPLQTAEPRPQPIEQRLKGLSDSVGKAAKVVARVFAYTRSMREAIISESARATAVLQGNTEPSRLRRLQNRIRRMRKDLSQPADFGSGQLPVGVTRAELRKLGWRFPAAHRFEATFLAGRSDYLIRALRLALQAVQSAPARKLKAPKKPDFKFFRGKSSNPKSTPGPIKKSLDDPQRKDAYMKSLGVLESFLKN